MIVKTIKELDELLAVEGNKKVGFVPTMGYLHEGHLSLIKAARAENDVVVVSVFVNPTQFAPNEDFDSYPRDIDRDYKLARSAGADFVFNPEVEEMYPEKATTFTEVEGPITTKLCGASRRSHFRGVTTVVNMLFNIVRPDNAYFGQKDAQQAIIIKKMVRDSHMKVNVVICPIVREEDGLAMSSRNIYLNEDERKQALILNQSLKAALKAYEEGEKDVEKLKQLMGDMIESKPLAKVDYVELLDFKNLDMIETVDAPALGAVAVYFGKTRLIDNVVFS